MRPRDLLYIGALLAVGFWVVESWVDYYFRGADSLASGFTPSSGAELYLRSLICVLFFLLGVTAYAVARKMQRTSERLRKVFEGATIGICEMDFSGEVISANPAARGMFGLNPTAPGVTSSFLDAIDPRDRDHVVGILRDATKGEFQRFIFRVIRGYETHTFSASLAPIAAPDGEATTVVAMAEDITIRTEARDSLIRFEHIVSASRDLIAFIDREGTFLAANPALAEHMGVDSEMLAGKRTDEIGWRMGFGPDLDTFLQRCLGGEEVSVQQWIKGERGERFVDVKMTPFRAKEDFTGVVISARDITESKRVSDEQKKLEAQILQAQKLESLGVMAGGIAHDFNNLLTGVLGNSALMVKELPEGDLKDRGRAIQNAAQRAAELCKQMLAYAGEEKPEVRRASLNSILADMSELLEASISKKAILHRGFTDDLPEAAVDATQISQVVMNLVTNASEALEDEPGDIRVSTGVDVCDRDYLMESYWWCADAEPGKYVYIEVSDTGRGMDEETQRTLLDPFFTTKFAGRGVGMAAVLGIVKSHRGAIRITSDEGEGTTIRVLIPTLSHPVSESFEESSMDSVWQVSGTVLVVDDEMAVQEVARDTLHLAGLSVLTARDGQEALRIYRENADDIIAVILDQTMPVMSGDETFRALRKMNPEVQVVLSSGFTQQDVADELMEQGLAGFVQKPYGPGDLLTKLREILH